MKFKKLMLTLSATAVAGLVLGGCAQADTTDTGSDETSSEPRVIKVAAVSYPMTDVVVAAAEAIEEGYEVELLEVGDYPIANQALRDGEVDANFSQHVPYMEEYNAANNASLVAVESIYNTLVSFYSREYREWDELPDNASIFIPEDKTNTARALDLMAEGGIITLDPEVERFQAGLDDIVENPKNVTFTQVGFPQLNAAYDEADAVFMYYAFAPQIDLDPNEDTIVSSVQEPFDLQLVTREELQDDPAIEALRTAFTSDSVRNVIIESGNEPAF